MTDLASRFNTIYDKLKAIIHEKEVSASNIMSIVASAMRIVDSFGDLSGPQKKEIVIGLIKKIVDDLPLKVGDKDSIQAFIDFTLPTVIDNIISATKGKFFNMAKDKIKSSWNCCATAETSETS
jgi:hypothetical protein